MLTFRLVRSLINWDNRNRTNNFVVSTNQISDSLVKKSSFLARGIDARTLATLSATRPETTISARGKHPAFATSSWLQFSAPLKDRFQRSLGSRNRKSTNLFKSDSTVYDDRFRMRSNYEATLPLIRPWNYVNDLPETTCQGWYWSWLPVYGPPILVNGPPYPEPPPELPPGTFRPISLAKFRSCHTKVTFLLEIPRSNLSTIYLSTCPPVYLSTCLPVYLAP